MVHPCPLLLTVCESDSHHCWDKLPQAQWLKVTDLLSCKTGSQKSMGRHGSVSCRGSRGVHLLLEATPAPCLVALISLSSVIPLPPSGITMWAGVFMGMKIWTSLGRLCLPHSPVLSRCCSPHHQFPTTDMALCMFFSTQMWCVWTYLCLGYRGNHRCREDHAESGQGAS